MRCHGCALLLDVMNLFITPITNTIRAAGAGGALAGEVLGAAEDFARSLTRKRFEETARSLPQTRAVLGSRFAPWFAEYATATPLAAGHFPALDALNFHAWLRNRKDAGLSSIERDALRYEQGWLTMQNSQRRFLLRWLAVPGEGATRVFVGWWRWRGKLRHWISG